MFGELIYELKDKGTYVLNPTGTYELNKPLTNTMTDGELLRAYVDGLKNRTIKSIYEGLEMSKTNFYQFFETQTFSKETKEKLEAYFGEKIFENKPQSFIEQRRNHKLNHAREDDITVYQIGTKASFIDIYEDEKNEPIGKLKGFTGNILLNQIDNNFLYAYYSHLSKRGNSKNTIWSSFKFLRTILNDAVKNDLLDKSPFKKFEMPKYEETNKIYLLPDEIKKIEKFLDKKCPQDLCFCGTWFLIACCTGLRLSDLRAFDKKKNIHGGRLVVKTEKTGDVIGLPIDQKLKRLFERIDYKPLHYTGEAYNRLLKLVSNGSGIDKKISSHTARHTAAMTLANAGISQEVAAKILGHSDMRSTSIYYKISNQRIDLELKKMKR